MICGMREPENIRAVEKLSVDIIAFELCKNSERYVPLLPSHAGLLPDYVKSDMSCVCSGADKMTVKAGMFVNEMPQNIITMAYNYRLDCICFDGDEQTVMIDNLRRTLEPDIRPGIKFMKTIRVGCVDDVAEWRKYRGVVDYLLFDITDAVLKNGNLQKCLSMLDVYDGDIPFFIGGGFALSDARILRCFSHAEFQGISIGKSFELSPAVIDVRLLNVFLNEIRS